MEHEVPNRRDDVNDFEDYDQEDDELPDLPTFSATNEFASNSEQVEENIDMAEEKEEVPMKDVEMDKNQDIDHSGLSYYTLMHMEWCLVDSWLQKEEGDLKHGLEHSVSSSYRANLGESFVLILL
ncbi:hypothetical protein Tco_1287564, partial [Tanacetum coccineum]